MERKRTTMGFLRLVRLGLIVIGRIAVAKAVRYYEINNIVLIKER